MGEGKEHIARAMFAYDIDSFDDATSGVHLIVNEQDILTVDVAD